MSGSPGTKKHDTQFIPCVETAITVVLRSANDATIETDQLVALACCYRWKQVSKRDGRLGRGYPRCSLQKTGSWGQITQHSVSCGTPAGILVYYWSSPSWGHDPGHRRNSSEQTFVLSRKQPRNLRTAASHVPCSESKVYGGQRRRFLRYEGAPLRSILWGTHTAVHVITAVLMIRPVFHEPH